MSNSQIILTIGIIIFIGISIIFAYIFWEDERLCQKWKDEIPNRKYESPKARRDRLESKYK